jgi:hypothetical protein
MDYSGNGWHRLRTYCVPFNHASPGATMHPLDLYALSTSSLLPNWIKIHDYVFKVNSDISFPQGCIGLSKYDLAKLRIESNSEIMIKLFHRGNENRPNAKAIGFMVKYFTNDDTATDVLAYSANEVLTKTTALIHEQFFAQGQEFVFPISSGYLVFKVTSVDVNGEITSSRTVCRQVYACANQRTKISFATPKLSNLLILNRYAYTENAIFYCNLTSLDKAPNRIYGNPILFHEYFMKHMVYLNYQDLYLHRQMQLVLPFLQTQAIRLTVTSIEAADRRDANDCFVKFCASNSLICTSSPSNVRIVTGAPVSPEAVKACIVHAEVSGESKGSQKPAWIVIDELMKYMRTLNPGFVNEQLWSFPIPGGSAWVKIMKVYKDDREADSTDFFNLDDSTDVEFYCAKDLDIPLVDTCAIYPLKSIKFDASAPKWVTNTSINYDVIQKAVCEADTHIFTRKQTHKVTIPNKTYPLTVQVSSTTFDPKTVNIGEVRYGILGEKTPHTKVEVSAKSDNLAIITKTPGEILADLGGYLKELGIGGISKKCLDYLANVLLAQGVARHELSDLMIKPPRGILLYGPPGTGKTTLARIIGNVLGIANSRVTLIDAPNLLNKWRGGSEKKIKELFDKAVEASEAQGANAPPYLIIIDEIDAIASKRDGHTTHDTVVNALLSGLSGLETSSNFFVVGITNRLELIDDAVKRPGRLYPHIAIGVPDLEGRKQIFEIHLRNLKEDGLLDDDVDITELAEATEDFTGAEIEGLVKQVIGEALPAAFKKDDSGLESVSIKSIKVTMKSLLEAIRAIPHYNDKANAPWRTIYT